jgi:hypothetical protein
MMVAISHSVIEKMVYGMGAMPPVGNVTIPNQPIHPKGVE